MRLPVYTTGRDGVLFTHIRNHLRVVSFVVAMVGVINTRSHRTDCIDLAVCSQFCHCTKWKNPRSPVRVITAIKTGAIIKHIPASSRQTKSDPVAPGPGGPRPSSAGQGPPRMEVPIENGRGQWWPSPSQRRTVSSETGQSPAGPRNFRDGMHRSRGGGGPLASKRRGPPPPRPGHGQFATRVPWALYSIREHAVPYLIVSVSRFRRCVV
jgi:hypothetical protein